jgi:hypothetical protein
MAATGGRRREVSDRFGDGRQLWPPLAGKLQESFFLLLFGRPLFWSQFVRSGTLALYGRM